MDKYDCLKLDTQLCFPMYACAKEIQRIYKPHLDKINLTYTQYVAMMVLWEEREATLKHIGERLILDSGTLTPLFRKLENKGFVYRLKDENDDRNLIIRITEKGLALRDKAIDIPKCISNNINLSQEEAYNLYITLKKLMGQFK
ncbi:MAG: MarR family transcriptional regulator [bacterium]|nr:MarR family transcriptional regulator [bacterium]